MRGKTPFRSRRLQGILQTFSRYISLITMVVVNNRVPTRKLVVIRKALKTWLDIHVVMDK